MSRKTIRTPLPVGNPEALITLLDDITHEHEKRETATPGSSPVDPSDITAIKGVVARVKPDRAKAKDFTAQVAALTESSTALLGLAPEQNLRTEGTGLFLAAKVRDALRANFRGRENELEKFGFKVVVGAASAARRTDAAAKP